jgi:hypothetical protein
MGNALVIRNNQNVYERRATNGVHARPATLCHRKKEQSKGEGRQAATYRLSLLKPAIDVRQAFKPDLVTSFR